MAGSRIKSVDELRYGQQCEFTMPDGTRISVTIGASELSDVEPGRVWVTDRQGVAFTPRVTALKRLN